MNNIAGAMTYKTELDTSGLQAGLGDVKNSFSTAGDWFTRKLLDTTLNGINAIIDGLVQMGRQAYDSFAEYEQLYDGMKSIFKDSKNQAEMVNKVTQTGNNAWKDMTMSYNDYYQAFNSTYPLMKAGIKDENDALEQTNRILSLESDLANTFGYDMQTAANAINWALKGNFSYVDNLNIGIKGTKEGFQEAGKALGYTNKEMKNLSSSEILDILEKTSEKYGVLGKTAEEAGNTIQGSTKMFQASWENLLIRFAEGGDIETIREAFNNLFESFGTLLDQIEPVITNIIDSLVTYLPGIFNKMIEYLPKLVPLILKIVQGVIKVIIDNLPLIVQTGTQLLISLVLGIVEAIPELIPALVDAINVFITTILDNLDLIIDAGIELMLALTLGLIDAIPKLLEKIPEIITKLVLALTKPEMLAKLVQASWQLIFALAGGLVKSVGELVKQVPTIISELVTGFRNRIKETDWGKLGKSVLEGILNGMVNFGNIVKDTIKKVGNKITGAIKNFFGIKSPSKLMRDAIGKQLTAGIAVGISANTDSVDNAIDDLNDDILDKMTQAVNFETGRVAYSGTNGTITQMLSAFGTTTVVNENKLYLDGDEIYENQKTVSAKKNLQTQFGGGYSVSS